MWSSRDIPQQPFKRIAMLRTALPALAGLMMPFRFALTTGQDDQSADLMMIMPQAGPATIFTRCP